MPGVQFQFISKSGGNQFHGSALANYENENIQSYDIDARQLAQGVASTSDNRLHQFYDRNADAGGPLKTDRLWWYSSFRDERSQARYANFPVRPFETRLTNYTGKATYQLSPTDKLILYGQAGKKLQPYRQDTARRARRSARTISSTQATTGGIITRCGTRKCTPWCPARGTCSSRRSCARRPGSRSAGRSSRR
jgi:hypothetical protein